MSVIFNDDRMVDRELAVRRDHIDECCTLDHLCRQGRCPAHDGEAEREAVKYLADRIVTWICLVGLVGLVLSILTGVIR